MTSTHVRVIIERMVDGDATPDHDRRGYDLFRPPVPVWVDLGAVFPVEGRPERFYSRAVDVQATVAGELHMWQNTTTGDRIGFVTFAMRSARETTHVTQWVPARALTDRRDAPARPEHRSPRHRR